MLRFSKLKRVMEPETIFKNGASLKSQWGRRYFFRTVMLLLSTIFTANFTFGQFGQYGSGRSYYGGGGSDLEDVLEKLLPVFGAIVGLIVIIVVVSSILRKRKNVSSATAKGMTPLFMGLRGKTREQKRVVRYFTTRSFFGITSAEFDKLLNSKADDLVSRIERQALEAHGMDADEVKEIPPILVEEYYHNSRYFKIFRDNTFRASEYQMTYLTFSEKQMYAYSYIFDLTSEETTEQTKEYFYKDITNIEVTKMQREHLKTRPEGYIILGVFLILASIPILRYGIGFLIVILGVLIIVYLGYSRQVVENLILKLTVAGDEFVCAMKPENMDAIQGMKAKIRDKKG